MAIVTTKRRRWSPLLFCACMTTALIVAVVIMLLNVQRGIGKSEWLIHINLGQPMVAGDSLVLMNRWTDESWSEYRVDITTTTSEAQITIPLTVYTETSFVSHRVTPDFTKLFVWVVTPQKLDTPVAGPLRVCNTEVHSNHIIECSACRTGDNIDWVPRPTL